MRLIPVALTAALLANVFIISDAPLAAGGTYANPFSLSVPSVNATVNGSYELLLDGTCNIYAEFSVGPTGMTPTHKAFNITLTPNLLCVPSVAVTDSVPLNSNGPTAGVYLLEVFTAAGDARVWERMRWYWNGDSYYGKPCGYFCGHSESGGDDPGRLHQDCWYCTPPHWHGWVNIGCRSPTDPMCGERISAKYWGKFTYQNSYLYLDAHPQAWWGYPNYDQATICKAEFNGVRQTGTCGMYYEMPVA